MVVLHPRAGSLDTPPFQPKTDQPTEVAAQADPRTTERRFSRAACGCAEELADYGCVARNGRFGAQVGRRERYQMNQGR